MDKVTILFVDDEPNILSGLQRLMRARKDEWQVFFCPSGQDALNLMNTQSMDVVVSDMRMPLMDGAEFLTQVRKRHPGTIRVILSGYADAECVLRTVGPAHIYLAKPCQPDLLMEAIARPLALRRLLGSAGLRAALAELANLPSPPELFFRLETELLSPRASVASVAAIIAQDVAMTAELLKLTNSAYFSNNIKATSILQAVRSLGLETIESLVLRIGIFRQLGSDSTMAAEMEALNAYSLRIAALAERIAMAEGADSATAKAAYCAGMLCSVGCLILMDARPDDYRRALQTAATPQPLDRAEDAVLGTNHALLGAYLLGLWGFIDSIVEAVAYGLTPSACPGRDNVVLTAVHAARALGPAFPLLPETALPAPKLDMAYICDSRKDLRIDHWRSLAHTLELETFHA